MNPVVLVALLAVVLVGCKRQEASTSSPTSADPSATTAPASVQPPGPPIQTPTETLTVAEGADTNATLDELSHQLRSYVSSTRSRPKDFQDFVTRARIQVPPPPAGKAYSISAGKVVLVNQ